MTIKATYQHSKRKKEAKQRDNISNVVFLIILQQFYILFVCKSMLKL
mgnify:CR=1